MSWSPEDEAVSTWTARPGINRIAIAGLAVAGLAVADSEVSYANWIATSVTSSSWS